MPSKQDPYAGPTQKAISLFSLLLFSGRRYFLADLASELDCSKQTVIRMMEQVEKAYGVTMQKGMEDRQRWYQIKLPRKRPNVVLQPDEIRNLQLCRDLVRHLLPRPFLKKLNEVVAKTTVLLPDMEERTSALDSLAGIMVKGGIDYTPFEGIIETLLTAIRSRTVCEVRYTSMSAGEARTHHFAPMRITAYREALYAEGWSVDPRGKPKQKYRMVLAVHRLEGVEPTRLLHDFVAWPAPSCFGFPECEPFRVKVAIAPSAARYVRERKWSDDQCIKDNGEAGIILEFTAQSKSEVVSWVLSFGEAAELLEPEKLRGRLMQECSSMVTKYDND